MSVLANAKHLFRKNPGIKTNFTVPANAGFSVQENHQSR